MVSIINCYLLRVVPPDLLRNVRTQVLIKLIKPYTRIHIPFISKQLNIDCSEVEALLVQCILDKWVALSKLYKIFQVNSSEFSLFHLQTFNISLFISMYLNCSTSKNCSAFSTSELLYFLFFYLFNIDENIQHLLQWGGGPLGAVHPWQVSIRINDTEFHVLFVRGKKNVIIFYIFSMCCFI